VRVEVQVLASTNDGDYDLCSPTRVQRFLWLRLRSASSAPGLRCLLVWREPALSAGSRVEVHCTLPILSSLWEPSFYFSATSYSTVGYGDIVPPRVWRLLGPVESVTGA